MCIFSHIKVSSGVQLKTVRFDFMVAQKVTVGCVCPTNLIRNLYNCPLTQCMKLHILEWAFLLVCYWESGRKIPFVLWWRCNLCANVLWVSCEWETKHGEEKKKKRHIKETWTLIFIKASHISAAFQQHIFDEITQNGSEEANWIKQAVHKNVLELEQACRKD